MSDTNSNSDSNKQGAQPEAEVAEVKKELAVKPEPGVHSDGITATIILGEKPRTITKLKAGKFYKAQEYFSEIYGTLSELMRNKDVSAAVMAEVERQQKDKGGETIVVDEKLVESMMQKQGTGLMQSILSDAPRSMAKFVAVCADMTEEELLDTAYAEEITEAFEVCHKLNRVMDNLKNFGPPTVI